MAKFGLFHGAKSIPVQVFDGDLMKQEGQAVKIFKTDPNKGDLQVGAIYLDTSLVVREIVREM
jgi:hypothetical protein